MLLAISLSFGVLRVGHSSPTPRAPASRPAAAKTASLGKTISLPIGIAPAPGTPSAAPYAGLDDAGVRHEFPSCNCFDSVNFLLSGDTNSFVYRTWRSQSFDHLDLPATWDTLEAMLRVGDVVEFIAHTSAPNGTEIATACHVQLCAQPGGLMVGANNEPQFYIYNGTPTNTRRWSLCTSRDYYHALLAAPEPARPHLYTLILYHHP